MNEEENCKTSIGSTYISAPKQNEEIIHQLWSTPIIMAKPFDDEFLAKMREDILYLTKDGGLGTKNQIDLWTLPDLPDTMIAVKDKIMEMSETAFRPTCEMPLPPFRVAKGYFRQTHEGSPYRIMPHRHANVLGVGIFYITATERNPGNLTFLDPRGGINWTNQFTAFKKIRVEEGLLIVHPGYLIHFVEPSNPDMGMYYDHRLALITNVHRTQEEWFAKLAEQDEAILKMGGQDY
jgi:hypothetical protein